MTTESEPADLLFNRGTLMDLFIGKPTFQKKLRPNDVLLEGIDESVLYLGHKKLLPRKALEELVTIEGKARRALADRSLEFPISGARFVQYSSLAEVIRSLQDLKLEWDSAVASLIHDYPDLRNEQLFQLDQQAETLVRNELTKLPGTERATKEKELTDWLVIQKNINRSLYPKTEDLSGMFKFAWRMFRISAMTGMEEVNGIQQEELIQAREAIQRELQRWVRQAAAEMHKVLGEAALNASNLLEKNGKLTPRNLKPLFDAFETFKAVDFTGSSTFQEVITQIRTRFGVVGTDGSVDFEQTASMVNDRNAMDGFRSLLSQVSELAQDDVADSAGVKAVSHIGEYKRLIEI